MFLYMAKSWVKRTGRKLVKGVVRAARKRYVKKGNLNLGKISKDVLMLKNLVNVEKKAIDGTLNTFTLGQVDGNSSGAVCTDITPVIAQGIGYTDRNGRSIKFTGMQFRLQLCQQSSVHDGGRFKLYIIKTVNATTDMNAVLTQFLDPDKLSAVIDYNSNRNPDFYRDFKIIAQRTFTIRPDQYSGAPNIVKDLQINLKLNHHLRYSKNTTTYTEGQMCCILVASSGNRSGTTASTLNVVHTAITTGFIVNHVARTYYVDN